MHKSTVSETELKYAKQVINSLDLKGPIWRLVTLHRWSKKQALEACEQYKNYLFVLKKYADGHNYKVEDLQPSFDVDEVWHAHILCTPDYVDFCNRVFHGYLHHHPHHGADNSIPQKTLEEMFEITQRLYFQEIGDYMYAVRPLPWKVRLKRLLKKFKATA